jgi:hypothetical protein
MTKHAMRQGLHVEAQRTAITVVPRTVVLTSRAILWLYTRGVSLDLQALES